MHDFCSFFRDARADFAFQLLSIAALVLPGVWLALPNDLTILYRVDTTVFGFSPDSLFGVDSIAKRSLIISSMAAAIGLFIDVWFIFAYSGADACKFQVSSRTPLLKVYGSLPPIVGKDALLGSLRLVLLLRTLFTPTHHRALRRRPWPRCFPRHHCVDCVAHRGTRHVRAHGCADKSAVHCVRFSSFCTVSRVDVARGLVGSSLLWEPDPGSFRAQPGQRPRRGGIAGTGASGTSDRASRLRTRYFARKAHHININTWTIF